MRTRWIAFMAGAVAAISASPAAAQLMPSATRASDPGGFYLHGHVGGAQLDPDVDDADNDYGYGAGAEAGFNFTRYLGVFAAADVARMKFSESEDSDEENYNFTHLEVGGRLNIPIGQRILPYVDVGYARRELKQDISDAGVDVTLRLRGNNAVAGGGLQFFVRPSVAVDLGARLSFGELDDFEAEVDGETFDENDFEEIFGEPFQPTKVTYSRLTLGLTWYPGARSSSR